MTRGIRNNNPGNIRWGDDWQGLVPGAQHTDKSFCQFVSPEYGIRAMIKIIQNYNRKYGINTVSGIISRWAPSNENNTDAYINHVCKDTGVARDQAVDVFNKVFMTKLIKSVITMENGHQPYSDSVIDKAFSLL
ncbi:structural protein [Photorhabdus laumondii subsp. laumondii]|uniref:Structural protein n=1 Tax=Photorhabdus laumondii subsp. laumondii TaxID=141679 RepID=A0A6L9JW42_PHOLM|nr:MULTISPECIES: structural protein [Photorhabdus]AXG42668.1 structural protein [Photorhabdus laumondii subsp. laumondii]MCC8384740.1 structural protein [Photorhabdus laumondii]MCC8413477.1 structural protein [Photorhabdus laumondii]NDK96477.1 structural protein [Photorhabdus laumondii subsp. laumondii]NDL17950.1 structural protein [Photorhabdus laumondii subsp. laumondii]